MAAAAIGFRRQSSAPAAIAFAQSTASFAGWSW
jgi:hypothetical protein